MPRDLSKQFESVAKFLRDTNPNANINAFLAHWRQDLGLSQQEALDLFDEVTQAMEALGLAIPDFTTFRELAKAIIDVPPTGDDQIQLP